MDRAQGNELAGTFINAFEEAVTDSARGSGPHDAASDEITVPFEVKAIGELKDTDGGEPQGVFEGLASTFGNVDLVGDVIEPGAFKAADGKPAKVKMLWQHDIRAPIGVFDEIEETAKGLRVKGRLALAVQQGAEAFELLKMRALDGLSIGFSIPKNGADIDTDGRRHIKKVDLIEISVVTLPANPKARVRRVKAVDRIETIRDFEAFLRDEGGFSHAAAKAIAIGGFKASTEPRDEDGKAKTLAALIEERRALQK